MAKSRLSLEIKLQNETLVLSEQKVVYWPKKEIIFIADLHLGKATHFRKAGIAIPFAVIETEIARIKNILAKFRPKKVVFLGDLFHSDLNHEWALFDHFLHQYSSIEFILIRGNHDILPDETYKISKLQVKDEPYILSPFVLSHHPLEKKSILETYINLCGHIHPSVSIKGKAKSWLRLPCFYYSERKLILPAFGKFTGLSKMTPSKGSTAFAVLPQFVQQFDA